MTKAPFLLLLLALLLTLQLATSADAEPASTPPLQTVSLCPGDRAADLLDLTSVDFAPDPLRRGQEATVALRGVLRRPVADGGVVSVSLKMGPIKLLETSLDLCDTLTSIGSSCPLPEGDLSLSHSFTVPNEVPSGKFTAQVHLKDVKGQTISCLLANLKL
ncbi:Phosphatidylglycerol/phosphatidylinositol transfer protein [Cladochytrium tenue]|nr:Phosphatidylglycerol/phosphatidylinositol transfer protein [Cladochytrium tenue]